jgi:hypothetical protein
MGISSRADRVYQQSVNSLQKISDLFSMEDTLLASLPRKPEPLASCPDDNRTFLVEARWQ